MLKDVKVGDWIFSIIAGWEKVIEIISTYEFPVRTEKCSFTPGGFSGLKHKHPSAWPYNPFDLKEKPPCEFKKGEVIMVADRIRTPDTSCIFAEVKGGLYRDVDGVGWKYARKLTAKEKGE